KTHISNAIKEQHVSVTVSINVGVVTKTAVDQTNSVVGTLVPVTHFYNPKQSTAKAELKNQDIYVLSKTDERVQTALANTLDLSQTKITPIGSLDSLPNSAIAFIPAEQLSAKSKLLRRDGSSYLDTFKKGAIFRTAEFSGDS